MKKYLAYIRVSTTRQGVQGVSLKEQREAIERYAERNGLAIAEWFEETVTAAKQGRRAFSRLMLRLRRGSADGVIIHKVDRSARNLRDWADLGTLIDGGVEVHFAGEGLDLSSRGGRLSADIQAVVAADFIRNLREEVRKGLYGRLKQGIYPWPAPPGYRNCGKGRAKEIDPTMGPLVRQAFELYLTGDYSLDRLCVEMKARGLRSLGGRPLYKNGLSLILRNPFYFGLIKIRKTGETFPGAHEPIVSAAMWEKAQRILDGRFTPRERTHSFLFRRVFRCGYCDHGMVGERQRGHVYYRCHGRGCATKAIREEELERQVTDSLLELELREPEVLELKKIAKRILSARAGQTARQRSALDTRLKRIDSRMGRLTDALVDGLVDQPTYRERKETLLRERQHAQDLLDDLRAGSDSLGPKVEAVLEQASRIGSAFLLGQPEEKRSLLRTIASNRLVFGKRVAVELVSPYRELAERCRCAPSGKSASSNRMQRGNEPAVEPPLSNSGDPSLGSVLSSAPYGGVIRTARIRPLDEKRCHVCGKIPLPDLCEVIIDHVVDNGD